ncbi:MAG: SDR family NAD(P)-dependent oxidoreductase [Acetobacteraceae bacterium]
MPCANVVIVTGAAGNLGSAVSELLTRQGSRVVAVARAAPRLAAAPALFADAADLTDPAEAAAVAAKAVRALGRIDGLVHTVGGFAMGSIAEAEPELWERMWRINLVTSSNMIRAVWPAMQAEGAGSIVAIGAQPAWRAGAGMAAYAGTKAAVLRLIEAAAEEGKPHGIRANAVLPGTMDTPQNRAAMPDADRRKWVTPAQVAEAIAFLLSGAASGINGAHLAVAGRG